jgi:hypothetical protein
VKYVVTFWRRVLMKVWIWDKNIGHKLFNFHDGYRVLPT